MPRVAVTLPHFNFFPELKAELSARYADVRFSPGLLQGDDLVAFLQGYDTAVIGVQRFTEDVLARCPDLKVISLCSAGVDHIDPELLNRHGVKMWWQPGINRVSVSELAVAYMVLTLRRVHTFSAILRAGKWDRAPDVGADRPRIVGLDTGFRR